MSLIGLIVLLIVIGVLFWAARSLTAAFGIGEPIRTVILVLLTVVALVIVLNAFGVSVPGLTGVRLRD